MGIKTGVTYPAGPCLVTHLRKKRRAYIVVLLNCKSMDQRWIDTCKIIDYCSTKIKYGLINDIKQPTLPSKQKQEDAYEDSLDLN